MIDPWSNVNYAFTKPTGQDTLWGTWGKGTGALSQWNWTHQPSGGKGGPCLGHLGSPHPVTVLGQQGPLEGGVCWPPQRHLQVVAAPVRRPVRVVGVTGAAHRALVSDQSLLDAEVVEAKGGLVCAQWEPVPEILRLEDWFCFICPLSLSSSYRQYSTNQIPGSRI